MDDSDNKRIEGVVQVLDREINRLQHQVLNNIDTAMQGSGQNEATLDSFIKKPLMHSVTQLKAQKMALLKMMQGQHLPNSANQSH